jgi:hypothetical protein
MYRMRHHFVKIVRPFLIAPFLSLSANKERGKNYRTWKLAREQFTVAPLSIYLSVYLPAHPPPSLS